MDLSFIFGLTAFLGAAWLYLLDVVLNRTLANPADRLLMPIACLHGIVFSYLVLALLVLYRRGTDFARSRQEAAATYPEHLLLGTWPVTLVAVAVSLAAAQLDLDGSESLLFVVFPALALLFGILTYRQQQRFAIDANSAARSTRSIVTPLVILSLASLPYVLVMSIIFSDVDIKLDKEFYEDGNVILTVRRGGYVFCPEIQMLDCGAIYQSISDGTYSIPLDEVRTANYLMVQYEPQVLPIRRKKFADLRIAQPLRDNGAEQPLSPTPDKGKNVP